MAAIVLNIIVVVFNLLNLSGKTKPLLRAFILFVIYINLSFTFILLHQYDVRDSLNEQIIEAKSKTISNQDTVINLQDQIIKRLETK